MMRKINLILGIILLTTSVWAQSPEKMSYQAVIRNSDNELVLNTQIGMQISILNGTTNGTAVYIETQTPTSNSNGLISIEIGGSSASVLLGTFSTIDWANGPFFIQTETDPTGGTNYTITGTSELLSVPYALHAKSAEIFTGTITEVDGSVSNEIQDLQLNGDILTITDNNTATEIDLSTYIDDQTVSITGGNGIEITGTYPNFTITQSSASKQYYIGEPVGTNSEDGIVFWVDHTGEHGLICSVEDLNGGITTDWSDVAGTVVPDDAISQFNGYENTIAINAQSSISAAGLCLAYSTPGTSAGDWYLPSIDELSKVYHVKYEINKALNAKSFELGYYWSSTEHTRNYAWYYSMDIGYSNNNNKIRTYYVRAVRAF
jgi:hypothetical protein